MIAASRSPVDAAAAAASSAAVRRCPTLVLQRQVVGQPRQMPCPGNFADVAQLAAPADSPPPAAGCCA